MSTRPHDRQRACQRGIARVGPAKDTCDDSSTVTGEARSFVTGLFGAFRVAEPHPDVAEFPRCHSDVREVEPPSLLGCAQRLFRCARCLPQRSAWPLQQDRRTSCCRSRYTPEVVRHPEKPGAPRVVPNGLGHPETSNRSRECRRSNLQVSARSTGCRHRERDSDRAASDGPCPIWATGESRIGAGVDSCCRGRAATQPHRKCRMSADCRAQSESAVPNKRRGWGRLSCADRGRGGFRLKGHSVASRADSQGRSADST